MSKKSRKRSNPLQIPRVILYAAKLLEVISPKLLTRFASRLFTTPVRYKVPKREHEMEASSRQSSLYVPAISKNVATYEFGESSKKVLLVHGWSGRGTQLAKIAESFVAHGYGTVSFDAPAHGKSDGKTTLMPEFIASILELDKRFGPFEGAVGHSLGGMSLLNAVKEGLRIKKLVIIGSGDKVSDILADFAKRLHVGQKLADHLRKHFEATFSGETMESFSAYIAAKDVAIPTLVIHDNDDHEVPAKCAVHIHKHLRVGELLLTKGLGHRKILGDPEVINRTIHFIKQ